MATYNPYSPTLPASGSSSFSAADVRNAFDDMARWSINVGDYASGARNIRNSKSLSARTFRPGSLTKVWNSGEMSPDSYLFFIAGSGSGTLPWSDYDYYDIPGASLNFYLRENVEAGGLRINSTVNFWKAREESFFDPGNNVTAATFLFNLTGYLDNGVTALVPTTNTMSTQYALDFSGSPPNFTRRGFNLTWTSSNSSMVPAGLHRFKLRLTSTISITTSTTPANGHLYNHIKGSGARTTVTAIYK
jgi:hypothetical protein